MKIYFLTICLFLVSLGTCQKVSETWLLFNDNELLSTARYRAMSGAFSALGGEFSAMTDNPAASGVFTNHQICFTAQQNIHRNYNTFNNNKTKIRKDDFTFGQIGAVWVYNNTKKDAAVTRISLGFNYNKRSTVNNTLSYIGTNTSSIGKLFVNYANGVNFDVLTLRENETISSAYREIGQQGSYKEQQAFLGYHSYLISPQNEVPNNKEYNENALYANGLRHAYNSDTTIYNRTFSFNISTRIQDNIYLGINFNHHILSQKRNTDLSESGFSSNSPIKEIYYQDDISISQSNGFSMQLGGIYKLKNGLRVSAVFSSPTWYNIIERQKQYIETIRVAQSTAGRNIKTIIDPSFDNPNEYNISTPYKLSGGIAYVFKNKKGLVSLQYDAKDYRQIKFRPSSERYFSELNTEIENIYRMTSAIRLGGEYVIKKLRLRSGMRYIQSPFQDQVRYGGSLLGYSAGVGLAFRGGAIDLSYDGYHTKHVEDIYNGNILGYGNSKSYYNNISLSVAFLF